MIQTQGASLPDATVVGHGVLELRQLYPRDDEEEARAVVARRAHLGLVVFRYHKAPLGYDPTLPEAAGCLQALCSYAALALRARWLTAYARGPR